MNARVLQGDLTRELAGQYQKKRFRGYGYGPLSETMAGFRHFRNCVFKGEFPFAVIEFSDADFPAEITMEAFNPFIPLKADDSSLPCAFFTITIKNCSDEPLRFDTAFSMGNPFEQSKNEAGEMEGFPYIHLKNDGKEPSEIGYGDLTVVCADPLAQTQPYWYRGRWQDGIATFWNEFSSGVNLHHRTYEQAGSFDMASIMGGFTLKSGEKKEIRFILSWNIPNQYNYWHPCKDSQGKDHTWKNYYATLFEDSLASALLPGSKAFIWAR